MKCLRSVCDSRRQPSRRLDGQVIRGGFALSPHRTRSESRRIPSGIVALVNNNASERALRGPVIGRVNYFGSRSRRGTDAAAILYSLVESAKRAHVDPSAYLDHAA